ncbi:MAG: cell division protein ZapA [Gemmatimonadaceae bacterium]|nr:cell division protein ZapA [Gemmatimonadaceae bacterium]MCW5825350.1 cell division protein ZapA [Gemmatimonadaceae bacterium]
MSVHSTRVRIVGEEYTIRSEVPPDVTRAIAEHVDAAIRKVLENPAITDPGKAAILAAMSITDELFKERAKQAEVAERMRSLSGELRRWLPPAKRVAI